MKRVLIPAFAMLGLTGCTIGPDYERPDLTSELPTSFSEAPSEPAYAPAAPPQADIAAWWTLLNDEELSTYVELAMTGSIELRESLERIIEARSRRGIENAERLPTLDGTGSYGRAETGDEGINFQGPLPGEDADVYSLGVVAGWELDLWGRVARLVEAADAEIEFAVEDYRAVRVALAAEVAREVITIRGLDLEIEAVEAAIAADGDNVDISAARVRAGFADELDLSRATRVLERNLAALPELQGRRRAAEIRLATLLGTTPDRVAVSGRGLPARDVLPPMGAPADLLLRRPDVRRAEAELIAANARVGAATAERYPRVVVSGTFAFQGTDAGDVVNPDAFGFTIGPTITVPLFEGGRIRARINVAESETRQAALRLQRSLITAIGEVESAAVLLRRTEERAKRLTSAERSALDTESLATDRYQAGVVDFLDVTEATTQLLAIRRERVVVERDATLRLIDLYAALGGGWDAGAEGVLPKVLDKAARLDADGQRTANQQSVSLAIKTLLDK